MGNSFSNNILNAGRHSCSHPSIHYYLGVTGPALAWVAAQLIEKHAKLLLVTNDRRSSEMLAGDLAALQKIRRVDQYSTWETLPFEEVSPQVSTTAERIRILRAARTEQPSLIVSSIEALAFRAPPIWSLDQLTISLNSSTRINREDLIQHLLFCGYRRVPIVEEVGDIAVRGSVIDFFPAGVPEPVRIFIEGMKIAELRTFNPSTQRSLKK